MDSTSTLLNWCANAKIFFRGDSVSNLGSGLDVFEFGNVKTLNPNLRVIAYTGVRFGPIWLNGAPQLLPKLYFTVKASSENVMSELLKLTPGIAARGLLSDKEAYVDNNWLVPTYMGHMATIKRTIEQDFKTTVPLFENLWFLSSHLGGRPAVPKAGAVAGTAPAPV